MLKYIVTEAETLRFLDVFLLHALFTESPPDTPDEIAALAKNQRLTASRGREPGLELMRSGSPVLLTAWAHAVLDGMDIVAAHMDTITGTTDHAAAVAMGRERLQRPELLPSAQVLEGIRAHGHSYVVFCKARSLQAQQAAMASPFPAEQHAHFAHLAQASFDEQRQIEASDTLPFEEYRQYYISADRLVV